MRNLTIIAILATFFIAACAGEKKLEQRFVYDNEKILDVETGDEYILDDVEVFTVVHKDGTVDKITIDEAPFYSGSFSADYLEELDKKLEERKLQLIEAKKNKLKEARKARYAALSDAELLAKFNESHANEVEFGMQLDMIAELLSRGVIGEDEAPVLLEIEPAMLELDIELDIPNF
jgi:hypothetical protein